jgi:hypothetical protein
MEVQLVSILNKEKCKYVIYLPCMYIEEKQLFKQKYLRLKYIAMDNKPVDYVYLINKISNKTIIEINIIDFAHKNMQIINKHYELSNIIDKYSKLSTNYEYYIKNKLIKSDITSELLTKRTENNLVNTELTSKAINKIFPNTKGWKIYVVINFKEVKQDNPCADYEEIFDIIEELWNMENSVTIQNYEKYNNCEFYKSYNNLINLTVNEIYYNNFKLKQELDNEMDEYWKNNNN